MSIVLDLPSESLPQLSVQTKDSNFFSITINKKIKQIQEMKINKF